MNKKKLSNISALKTQRTKSDIIWTIWIFIALCKMIIKGTLEFTLFIEDECLWISWVILTHKFTP